MANSRSAFSISGSVFTSLISIIRTPTLYIRWVSSAVFCLTMHVLLSKYCLAEFISAFIGFTLASRKFFVLCRSTRINYTKLSIFGAPFDAIGESWVCCTNFGWTLVSTDEFTLIGLINWIPALGCRWGSSAVCGTVSGFFPKSCLTESISAVRDLRIAFGLLCFIF